MLLAGDVGGTKTLMGLYQPGSERPRPLVVREYATLDFDSLPHIVQTFLDETGTTDVSAISVGVAGPVNGLVARLVNVPWMADLSPLAEQFPSQPAQLLNDLEAMAIAVPVLEPDELEVLQSGIADPAGNAALIAAGTGLGEALLHNINGRFFPSASEGGHADFAARTGRELALVEDLTRSYGRVENERVISGPGLVNIFRFMHTDAELRRTCPVMGSDLETGELPAAISKAALESHCPACVDALDMFIEAYGSEAGNLALRSVATAGVYIGGGIAPKILPALKRGLFMEAFRDKEPLADMLRTIPVFVILNPAAGLLGAAVRAASLTAARSRSGAKAV
jgi:glucokinase